KKSNLKTVYILIIVFGLYVIARQIGLTEVFQKFPTVSEEKVSFALLFVIGLLTSVHCVAMCGGINLTQSVVGKESRPIKKSILYNAGRLVGYTAVGGVLGFIGEAASVTLRTRGIIGLAAGAFMVLTGINMLTGIGFLKKLTPSLPKSIASKIAKFSSSGSFAIGIANALMPCGPLQSMQLYAVSTGGFVSGSLSMFFFCLGTVPLMFAFGAVAGVLKKKYKTVMIKASTVLVIFLGIFMLQNNLALIGLLPAGQSNGSASISSTVNGDMQYVTTELHSNGFDDISVKMGVPVTWTIVVRKENLNGCNNEIVLPEYGKQIKLHEGENIIEFTPTEKGAYTYTCWMGMLKNTITVE
ncbi:MAG: sulfite exporter TauE/SafE family protein, partial [Acutalibacteraceae bacterium]